MRKLVWLLRSNIGASALHVAAFNGRLETCKLLLAKGARIDATNREGFTALAEVSAPAALNASPVNDRGICRSE